MAEKQPKSSGVPEKENEYRAGKDRGGKAAPAVGVHGRPATYTNKSGNATGVSHQSAYRNK